MALRWGLRAVCAFGLMLAAKCGVSQALPEDTDKALSAMAQQAGVIFSGRVTAVWRDDGAAGATGVVEIEFSVEDAVRGTSGSRYTMREWAGLWPAGDEPFHVGERLLMLLYAPGASGLSSPVGGMAGAIPLRAASAVLSPQRARIAAAGSPEPAATETLAATDGRAVDLRWVETRVARPLSYGDVAMEHLAGPHAEAAGMDSTNSMGASPVPAVETAPQSVAYAVVLAGLRSTAGYDHGQR